MRKNVFRLAMASYLFGTSTAIARRKAFLLSSEEA